MNDMFFGPRDVLRYGLFSATCDRGVGRCTVSISIYGFGDLIEIKKGESFITSVDTNEDDCDFEQTGKNEYDINGYHVILGKCLKRWR